jgi:hypothetical protein
MLKMVSDFDCAGCTVTETVALKTATVSADDTALISCLPASRAGRQGSLLTHSANWSATCTPFSLCIHSVVLMTERITMDKRSWGP